MGSHAPQHRHPSSHDLAASCIDTVRRPTAASLLAAALIAVLPVQALAGQLVGGLLDQPLSTLSTAVKGSTRVIIRTDRGLLAPVIRLVTALGGRVVAQHAFIDAVTVELPAVQL